MNEANGNNHTSSLTNDSNESELILTTGGVGEIKAALGRLYKKVNDLEITQKAEREQNRAELKAWAQTNLIQTQLLNKQVAVIEILTQELKNKENSWEQLEQNSDSLLKELNLWKQQLQNMPKPTASLESVELKGLKTEVFHLRTAISSIPTKLNEITLSQTNIEARLLNLERPKKISQSEAEDLNFSSWLKAGQTAIAFLILFFLFSWISSAIFPARTSADTMAYLQEIWQRTGWANTKLQRIEKKLGTTPKP